MKNTSVTKAIYDAGFNSSGRFYEKSKELLGMTPTRFRTGGANEEINFALGQITLGAILVASSKNGVVAVLLGDNPEKLLRDLQDRFPRAELIGADKEYEKLVARVVGLIEAPGQGLNLPLDIRGTAFQRRVWRALKKNLRRNDRFVCGSGQKDRITQVSASGRGRLRRKQYCSRHSLPSRCSHKRFPVGIRMGHRSQARTH
jgi:hypothetical protein